ncbi:MAG TPA: DUF6134 family protein [Stellaceae bacterium]|nr:DUF6134 family protein [Stellaceae bacterium]
MSRTVAPVTLGLVALLATARTAFAAPEIYEYRIVHASHGEIGRYANIVDRRGNDTEVRTELHIAVTILGITAYRQDAERVERWHGERLTSFDGTTVTNGERLQVHGEVQGGGFAVTTPTGIVIAPADVHPSNPWSVMVLRTDWVMSTRTGKLFHGIIKGGDRREMRLSDKPVALRQYEIVTDKHEFVWLNDQGTPVAFRTQEDGDDIDFILQRREPLVARTE